MLKLCSLSIWDFLSHKESHFSFSDPCRILIDGKSGAGKTAIVEAIVWCLFGRARVDNRFLVRKGAKSAVVELDLFGKNGVKIQRSVDQSGKQKLSVGIALKKGEEFKPLEVSGLRNIQEWIEKKLLHASYALFVNSIAYPQDGTESFILQSASKRKELLLEILGANDFDFYYERAKRRLALEDEALIRLRTKSAEQCEMQEQGKNASQRVDELLEQIKECEEHLNALNGQIYASRGIQEGVKALRIEVGTLSRELSLKKETFQRVERQRGVLLNLVEKDADQDVAARLEKAHEEYGELNKELGEFQKSMRAFEAWEEKRKRIVQEHQVRMGRFPENLESEIEMYRGRLEKLEGSDYKCKACGAPVPQLEKNVLEQRAFFEQAIKEREALIREREEKLEYFQESLKALGDPPKNVMDVFNERERRIAELSSEEEAWKLREERLKTSENLLKELNDLSNDLERFRGEVQEAEKKLEERKTELEEQLAVEKTLTIAEKEKEFKEVESEMKKMQRLLGEQMMLVDLFKKACEEIKKIEAEQRERKEKKEALEAVKEAFSPRGLKTLFIDSMVPKLEEEINEVLGKLSDFRVEIETQRDNATGDGVVEGLFINIIDERGNKLEFNSYSGGERLKIIVSISEALASLQKIGFRIVDELFIGLDNESTEQFVEVLNSIQNRFSQFFVISHLQTIKDLFAEKIEVRKVDGISEV